MRLIFVIFQVTFSKSWFCKILSTYAHILCLFSFWILKQFQTGSKIVDSLKKLPLRVGLKKDWTIKDISLHINPIRPGVLDPGNNLDSIKGLLNVVWTWHFVYAFINIYWIHVRKKLVQISKSQWYFEIWKFFGFEILSRIDSRKRP